MVSSEQPVSPLTLFGRCCKWLLYAFNVLFLLSGIAAISVGVWTVADPTSYRVVVLTNSRMYIIAAFILMGAGAAAIFVSILGCFGARFENRCLLVVYAALLLLIFVAEFAAGVLALAYYTEIDTLANMEMREAVVSKYGQANQHLTTEAYNYMQNKFDCCGFVGTGHNAAQLYQVSLWFESSFLQVPPSCCKRDENGEPIDLESCQDQDNPDLTFVNNFGCKGAVVEYGIRFATVLSAVGIGLALLQLIGMMLAFCLYRRL